MRTSPKLYFRERTPWRTGTVKLAAGPVIICHLHGDCDPLGEVKLINRLRTKAEDVQDITVPTPADVELLSKIRDLLEEQNKVLSKK